MTNFCRNTSFRGQLQPDYLILHDDDDDDDDDDDNADKDVDDDDDHFISAFIKIIIFVDH